MSFEKASKKEERIERTIDNRIERNKVKDPHNPWREGDVG